MYFFQINDFFFQIRVMKYLFSRHIDGHHKLTRWRLVIHGTIDGHSRLITYLQCNNNNLAVTVLHLFLDTISVHGLESEQISVQKMLMLPYLCQNVLNVVSIEGAFIAGTFVHNHCIERLWGEVIRCVVRHFRNMFFFLENEGFLDPLNEVHVFVLHTFICNALPKPSKSLATIGDIVYCLVKGISHHTNFGITV